MTKYSNEFKTQITKEYYSGKYSSNDLAIKYNIGISSSMKKWVYLATSQCLVALKIKKNKRKYNVKFKL